MELDFVPSWHDQPELIAASSTPRPQLCDAPAEFVKQGSDLRDLAEFKWEVPGSTA